MLFLNYFVKNYIQSGDWYYPPGGGPRKKEYFVVAIAVTEQIAPIW